MSLPCNKPQYFQLLRTLLLLVLIIVLTCESVGAQHVERECLTNGPSDELLQAIRAMHKRGNISRRGVEQPAVLSVDTHLHIVMADGERENGLVTDVMVAAQIRELELQYKVLGIILDIRSSSVTTNTTWARNGDDFNMKATLRRGSYSSLNIYFQTQLARDPDSAATTQFLGFSAMPDLSGRYPMNASYITDGCNIHAGTMPGGYVIGNDMGKTAVHEVGHWFGLQHTFWGYSCEGDGDFIDDTRQERTATSGCPRAKNSCPELEGVDPITNFMDYSSDDCYEGFTRGQQDRMHETFAQFRQGF